MAEAHWPDVATRSQWYSGGAIEDVPHQPSQARSSNYLEQLQALGLLLLECAVADPTAIGGLIRDPDPLGGHGDRQALAGERLDLAELGDDLLDAVLLYGQHRPPSVDQIRRRRQTMWANLRAAAHMHRGHLVELV